MYECSVFFDPKPEFFKYFSKPWLRWRKFHDIGTGTGLVPSLMQIKGFDVSACDMHDYPNQKFSKTHVMRSEDYVKSHVNDTDVILICRPCHAMELTKITVNRALHYGADVYYVGLERNFGQDDLCYEASKFKPSDAEGHENGYVYEIVARDVGQAGEHIVRIYGRAKDMQPFVKYKTGGGWFKPIKEANEPDTLRLVNRAGGHHYTKVEKLVTDFDFRFMAEQDQADPDLSSFDDYKPEHDIGWLSPRGDFYPCDYAAHDNLAYNGLKVKVARLEKLGFVRAHGNQGFGARKLYSLGDYSEKRRLTPQQKRWLVNHDYEIYIG